MNDVSEIFEYWQQIMGKTRSRIDAKRERAIRARLRDGYSVQDLKDAIQGCAWSRFHCGENDRHRKYQDIELICRDAQHVDDFIAEYEKGCRQRARIEQVRANADVQSRVNPQAMAQLKAIVGGRTA